ncbi:MAG: ATP-binding protein [Ferruginibacter sp.]
MNQHLQNILNIIQQDENLSSEQKDAIAKSLKDADKELEITAFKLDRTEKVKRTTAILLEETIQELDQKRKAIEETNAALQKSLEELKAAQQQLIQSEKMASLGELTAGIAHEIQNPLNFVNNFSEVSNELIDEMKEELEKGDIKEAEAIAADVKQNLEKINHHGQRAADIVKGMLQHSRSSTGQKEPTDINALCDEYLRLAYHGLRAKDKSFNAKFETDFDPSLPKINVVPQDIGRVILNLINNAFYTVSEKAKSLMPNAESYEPTVVVSTKNLGDKVEVKVKDNGNGISEKIKDKIFQPFFTTKPTGQGTGLGLSLSYDIVKAHGRDKNGSANGAGTEFTVVLPVNVEYEMSIKIIELNSTQSDDNFMRIPSDH